VSSSERVIAALDESAEITSRRKYAGAVSFLFLPGIAKIDVLDRARGFRTELEKTEGMASESLGEGAIFRYLTTTRRRKDLSDTTKLGDLSQQDWWLVERLFGGGDPHLEAKAAKERRCCMRQYERSDYPRRTGGGSSTFPLQ